MLNESVNDSPRWEVCEPATPKTPAKIVNFVIIIKVIILLLERPSGEYFSCAMPRGRETLNPVLRLFSTVFGALGSFGSR
jgi:hypothetical protein